MHPKYDCWVDRWSGCIDGQDGVNLFLLIGLIPIVCLAIVCDYWNIQIEK